VLQAEPGAGKSTALPLSLLEADFLKGKKIVMLEPRRLAAKSIAHYLAKQLGESVGQRIGYQIKNDRKISQHTQLEIVTEGILTRRLQQDPELNDTALIIFDEFHERSLHADLALMLCLEVQQSIRDDLKLLVMSATIDTQLIANYINTTQIIECPGSCYPVTTEYLPVAKQGHPLQNLINTLMSALNKTLSESDTGDILVFLSGQGDIHRAIQAAQNSLNQYAELQFLPLYGSLSLAQQEQALQRDSQGRRRIIFSTNIAETSLTIDNICCVIDSGLEKVLIYEPNSAMTALHNIRIAKASATQRAGRAGRTQAGHCIRLWSEQQQQALVDFQSEEILRADLIDLVLELSIWGNTDYDNIEWLTPPPKAHFFSARQALQALHLMDQKGNATALGEQAIGFGLPIRLATLLLNAKQGEHCAMACELASLLADRDIFNSVKGQSNFGVDIIYRLLALQDYKRDRTQAMHSYPIKRAAIEQLLSTAKRLKKQLKVTEQAPYTLNRLQTHCASLLLFCYPERLAKRRDNQTGRYQMANGKGVFLYPDDPLFNEQWLVVADCDAQSKEGRIFNAAAISYAQFEPLLETDFQTQEHFKYDAKKQQISATQSIKYRALTLKSQPLTNISKEIFEQCLKDILAQTKLDILHWSDRCQHWLARAQWLGSKLADFPDLSKAALCQNIDQWLMPYLIQVTSIKALKKINLLEILQQCLSWEQQQLLEREAPTHYKTPSNKSIPISYDTHRDPFVSVVLQEMFGELSSPRIGSGTTAITFELLSPAKRPIQTTSDLANFWQSSYFEVAKDMRGKYPKHRWPDQPLLEKAGRSIKPKQR
jgi:ATP-dependent helicase HrpB